MAERWICQQCYDNLRMKDTMFRCFIVSRPMCQYQRDHRLGKELDAVAGE